jgi:hypothetical protein
LGFKSWFVGLPGTQAVKEKALTQRSVCLTAIRPVLVGHGIAQDNRITIQGSVNDPMGGMVATATKSRKSNQPAGFIQEANR